MLTLSLHKPIDLVLHLAIEFITLNLIAHRGFHLILLFEREFCERNIHCTLVVFNDFGNCLSAYTCVIESEETKQHIVSKDYLLVFCIKFIVGEYRFWFNTLNADFFFNRHNIGCIYLHTLVWLVIEPILISNYLIRF